MGRAHDPGVDRNRAPSANPLLRLDQLLGHQPEPVAATAEPPHFGVRMTLPEPIGLQSDVMAGLKRAGIAPRDIATSNVGLNPQYRYTDGQPPAITGYQASNNVNVVVRDIAKLGRILDALVATGANQVNGPSFDVEDKESAYDEARKRALDKAQQRAAMYAKSLGMQVRRIVSISEGGGFAPPQPMAVMSMVRAEKMADTSISPGENTLSVNLDVVFELGR